jgi:hypothetical protein
MILDPFGGSGVTLVEALMLGRKAIHIDLNPLSKFIVKNLIEPIDLGAAKPPLVNCGFTLPGRCTAPLARSLRVVAVGPG